MQEHEQYCTVAEAAARLQRTEAEIWRMLETGALPAMLRANQTGKDGEPLGFDFALLPPEGVRILADQSGDDFRLEWPACGGHIKATCYPARASSVRVMWEPALFPELMPEAVRKPASETPQERRHRWLDALGAEEKIQKRGALQRLTTREGVDHSNMSKAIKKARAERDEQRRAGIFNAQLVRDGKRIA